MGSEMRVSRATEADVPRPTQRKISLSELGLADGTGIDEIMAHIYGLAGENRRLREENRSMRVKTGNTGDAAYDRLIRRTDAILRDGGGGTTRFVEDEVGELFAEARRADPDLDAAAWYREHWQNHPEQFLRWQREKPLLAECQKTEEARETERLLAEHAERERAAHPVKVRFERLLAEARGAGLSIAGAYKKVTGDHPEILSEMQAEKVRT